MKASFYNMRRVHLIRSCLIVLTLLLSSVFQSYSAASKNNSINYFLLAEDPESKNSSTFTVNLYAEGKAVLSAATVKVSFSENEVELSNIKGASSVLEIRSYKKSDSVKTILLCENGYSFKKQACLLSYRFKKKVSTPITIDLSVSDTVDYKLNQLKIGNVSGCYLKFASNNTIFTYKSKAKVRSEKNKIESSSTIANKNKAMEIESPSVVNANDDSEVIIPEKAEEAEDVTAPKSVPENNSDGYEKLESNKSKVTIDLIIFCLYLWLLIFGTRYVFKKLKVKYDAQADKLPEKCKPPSKRRKAVQKGAKYRKIKIKKALPSKTRLRPVVDSEEAEKRLKEAVKRRKSQTPKKK